jgi:hypothetical protein
VLFATGQEAAQVGVDGDLPLRVYWTGLTPGGSYSLTATGSGVVALELSVGGSLQADDSGLLAVEISSSGSATPLY